MSDTPTPRSYSQTLGDMFDSFLSEQGIRSLRAGSPIVSILEAAAQSDMRNSQDIFNLLMSADLDNATGLALARIGRSERVPKLEVAPSTGKVTISDTSFSKISSKLFQGSPAPIVGSLVISVVDATLFPAAGDIYIGRGTNNYEGPLTYSSKSDVGNHWELTLSSGTTKFHNVNETVILAQGGNRTVGPNTTVRTPQANVQNAIEFRTIFPVTIADGETEVTDVQVVADKPGKIGNVIAGIIREFATSPFTGATVTNPAPFVNGRETESDDDYRERIRDVRASRQLGTALAITTAVTGITAPDENKRINSASLVKRFGFPATLYIDDGTGYEERTDAIAIESLMDEAVGGEDHFQVTQRPIARAFATTKNTAPFVLRPTDQLSVRVGGTIYHHPFDEADFHSISSASVFEVVASINSNPDVPFSARSAESGTKVAIFSNSDTNEDIEVLVNDIGTDGNEGLGFPAGINYTMRLYKNDRLLTKDGVLATMVGLPFAQWNTMSGLQTLSISVDHCTTQNFYFTDQDFIDAETGYATMGRNSLAAWVAVINARIPGITASESAGRLVLTSNAGPVARAGISIEGGSLVSNRLFNIVSVEGAPRDYTLDRNEGQIALTSILEAGDRLTAGSFATRAFLESDEIGTTDLANDAKLWFAVDGDAEIIQHGVVASTDLLFSVSEAGDWGRKMQIQASPAAFENVETGDWMVIWDDAAPDSMKGVHRVTDASNTYVTIERHSSMLTRRTGHASVRLQSSGTTIGKILTCGGGTHSHALIDAAVPPSVVLKTAEIYDPNTKTVTACAQMNTPRMFHTATVVASGKVVVTGGQRDNGLYTNSIEIYDPTLDTWTTSIRVLTTARARHTATLLTDGRILIAGGDAGSGGVNTYQIYDAVANTITTAATMNAARSNHCAVLLPDDTVLIAGGYNGSTTDLATAELFTPGPDTFALTDPMTRARSGFGMALVEDPGTKVIAVGNRFGATGNDTYEEYDLGSNTWGAETTIPVTGVYEDKPVLRTTNGDVVYLDASNGTAQTGFVYDGTTFTAVSANAYTASMGGPRWYTRLVELKSGDGTTVANKVASIGGSYEHSTAWAYQPTAILNTYDGNWDEPDPANDGLTYNFSDAGIAFVRSDRFVQEVVIPAGTNYTANSLVDVFNEQLVGSTASPYKTTRLRINTNRYADGGDISLITQNLDAESVQLAPSDAIENIASHVGSVETSSGLGTPTFESLWVASQSKGTSHPKLAIPTLSISPDQTLVGLRNWIRAADAGTFLPAVYVSNRGNGNFQFRTTLESVAHGAFTFDTTAVPRDESPQPWGPLDRIYFASPYAVSPNGTLEVVVDNDITKHFSINMWRTLKTVGSTYAATNTFKDGDQSDVSLATTFGLDYDFNDYAVYMAARAVAFSGESDRQMVLRYFRLGPDGDDVQVLFGNPDAPDEDLKVETEMNSSGDTRVTIKLKSGSLRAATVHNSTRIGYAVTSISGGGQATLTEVMNLAISSASRTTNVVTATVTLPSGVTDHGLAVSDSVWVESTNVNFSSGLKLITAVTGTTITYDETAADIGATANIGTVSFDSEGEATLTGSSTVAGDFFRIEDPSDVVTLGDLTFQIASVDGSGHNFTVTNGDQIDGTSFALTTTLVWQRVVVAENCLFFANDPQTAQEVVDAINALQDAEGSTCPIKAVETGDGTGLISQNSPDEVGASSSWYTLADGINWVKTTTSPGSIAGDYDLTFKNSITSGLATGSDWANEIVRLVPITTNNIVGWLNTPTVTGLFTETDIEASDDGTRVQITTLTAGSDGGIEIQGGIANSVIAPVVGTPAVVGNHWSSTIDRLDGDGLHTNMWCRIDNENPLPKQNVLWAGLTLNSWTADGQLSFDNTVVDEHQAPTQLKLSFEKQGKYIAISDVGGSSAVNWASFVPGSMVRLSAATSLSTGMSATSDANLGLFRILRVGTDSLGVGGGTLYIENTSAVEEFSECMLAVYGHFSVMPGDKLIVLSDIWGEDNIGTWTVTQVGTTSVSSDDPFANLTSFCVDISGRAPVPQGTLAALTSSDTPLIFIREGTPSTFIMKVDGVTLNQDDGDFLDIRWDKTGSLISAAAGSVITVLDKLDFPTTFAQGVDGYRYDTGLLREANKVVYGDPTDSSTYPGVAAADSHINIQGPLVKRIQVSLSIRVKSGLNTQDIGNRVRSAVATVVNKTPIGKSISFSDIIDAAREVTGVVSVTIIAPLYSVGHDQIAVQPYEKPFVIDLAQDVQVSFVGV